MNPIFEREFVAFSRKRRFFVLRGIIVGLPLVLVMFFAAEVSDTASPDRIGRGIFGATSYTLLLLAMMVMPGMLAHSISGERQANTLDVLLTTRLSARGIVLGKWFSRCTLVAAICLAGLPLCGSSLVFGGVDPWDFIKFAGLLLLCIYWVGAMATLVSAATRDVALSIRMSYLALLVVCVGIPIIAAFVGRWMDGRDAAYLLLALNPIFVLVEIDDNFRGFWTGLGYFTYFAIASSLSTLAMLAAAVLLVRREGRRKGVSGGEAAPARSSGQPATPARRVRFRRGRLPRLLDTHPAIWLELNHSTGRRRLWVGIVAILIIVGLEFTMGYAWISEYREQRFYAYSSFLVYAKEFPEIHMLPILGFLGIAVLMALSAGASSFHRGSSAKTLETLHAAPIESRDLASAKIIGVLVQVAPFWLLSVFHAFIAWSVAGMSFFAFLGYAIVSAIVIGTLLAASMSMSLWTRSTTVASIASFGGFGAIMIAIPIVIGIFLSLFVHDDGVMVNLALGWHPGYMVSVPLLLGVADGFGRYNDGYWISFLYAAGYAGIALFLFKHWIPARYHKKRLANWM